jgi:transposase
MLYLIEHDVGDALAVGCLSASVFDKRTIAWFGAFRRLLVRHERATRMFLAFFQLAAALIALRRL